MTEERMQEYWKKNVTLINILLVIWALVSYGAGILFAPALSGVKFFGVPMSFWFAHQGSMVIFVIMIFYYCITMDKLDKEYDVHEDRSK